MKFLLVRYFCRHFSCQTLQIFFNVSQPTELSQLYMDPKNQKEAGPNQPASPPYTPLNNQTDGESTRPGQSASDEVYDSKLK